MRSLTEGEIQRIVQQSVGTPLAYGVAALDAEITRLADKVSDCWLLLDQVARGHTVNAQSQAKAMLRKHKAPGWKEQP